MYPRGWSGRHTCTPITHFSPSLHTSTIPYAPLTRSTLVCRPLLAPLLQYSLQGGVVVQVTGVMQRPGGPKRPFVQVLAVCNGWTAAVGKRCRLPDWLSRPALQPTCRCCVGHGPPCSLRLDRGWQSLQACLLSSIPCLLHCFCLLVTRRPSSWLSKRRATSC